MYLLTKLITALILPPFNVLILWIFSLLFARKQYKKLSLICAVLGITILYVFSIPYTAQKLQDSLVKAPPLSLADYKTAQAIVVLGGGLRDSNELFGPLAVPAIPLERLRYAAYLHQQTQLPILITGASPNGNSEAKIMAKELQDFFHTPTQWLEEKAQTTIQNAQFTRTLLEKAHIQRIILVTNQWHMQRAKFLFEKQGFRVLPASVGNGITPESYGLTLMHFIPQASAMPANMQALKEWLGYWKAKF
ncbi:MULTISPECIES: YdcF family protein [unclassified Avibacterium]|uniref:YdcF family protein n=1 Tax=unclassified Avibacterium TaxID=2685287 RepID=UPI0021888C61|nr:YdcF family protein [Avibacterium sp. 20-129]MCW9700031.1 YdcF family protein [Avibacterium sp. 20-129]URL03062.1 YdcF family protein [Avibacterium sp. 20-126]